MVQLKPQEGEHLAGLVSRFFDNLAGCSFEYGDEPKPGDFVQMCRDFHPPRDEMRKAQEIDGRIIAVAREILGFE